MFLLSCLVFLFSDVNAQDEYIMTTSSHQSAVSDYCHVFDDGGSNSPYSNYVSNATYTITSTNPNARFRIIYDVNVNQSKNKAKVEIIDGDQNSTNRIDSVWGVVKKRIYSSTNTVTIRFNADDDTPKDGFDILLIACECLEPTNIKSESLSASKIKLSWDSPYDNMTWTVDYVLNCDSAISNFCLGKLSDVQTITTTDNFVEIDGLANYGSFVAYDIYGECGTITACGSLDARSNPCKDIMPENIKVDTVNHIVSISWDEPNTDVVWYIKTDFEDMPDAIRDTNFWTYYYPDTCGTFTFRITGSEDGEEPAWCDWENALLQIDCPCSTFVPDTIYWEIDYATDSVHFWWDEPSKDVDWYVLYNSEETHLTEPSFKVPIHCSDIILFQVVGDTTNSENIWCNSKVFSQFFDYPCKEVYSITATEVTANSITVEWQTEDENVHSFFVMCSDSQGNVVYHKTVSNTNSITVNNLDNYTKYTFKISVICQDNRVTCGKNMSFWTKYDDCLDFTDFSQSNLTFRFGTYEDPYKYVGNSNDNSRYSVCSNLNEIDYLTGMSVIPPNEKASVKLGNPQGGKESESIAYTYSVDTNSYDMLILQYAIVLEDPNHTKLNQPRFTLEILDSESNLIDSKCGYVDFYAAGDLGWNKVSETSNIIWKDWTTMGIDLTPYHEQQIQIRFTTYDCNDGGHFGYAYYNITCAKKRLDVVNRCLHEDSVSLVAPNGFYYSWFKENSSDTISHDRQIIVPADNSKYNCLLSFIGNMECNFLLQTNALSIKPKADYTYNIDTCLSKINFTSTSYLDYDHSFNISIGEKVDSIFWILDNGEVFVGNDFSYIYTNGENVHIKMLVTVENSMCRDSVDINIPINMPFSVSIVGKNVLCANDSLYLTAESNVANATYLWNNGAMQKTIGVQSSSADTLYYVSLYVDNECKATAYHYVKVDSSYDDTIFATICRGEQYTDFGFSADKTGIYTQRHKTTNGCDSLLTLNLVVRPSYYDTLVVESCDFGYYDNGFHVDSSGTYTIEATTVGGCDSVIVLYFTLYHSFSDTVRATLYKGQTYTDDNFSEKEKGVFEKVFTDMNGCDSIYVLDLDILEFKFPNVITANGDGINDLFEIYSLIGQTLFDEVQLVVFNRYGKQVFAQTHFEDNSDFWDPAATNSPTGTYFYRFIAKSKQKNLDITGSVEVLR